MSESGNDTSLNAFVQGLISGYKKELRKIERSDMGYTWWRYSISAEDELLSYGDKNVAEMMELLEDSYRADGYDNAEMYALGNWIVVHSPMTGKKILFHRKKKDTSEHN